MSMGHVPDTNIFYSILLSVGDTSLNTELPNFELLQNRNSWTDHKK